MINDIILLLVDKMNCMGVTCDNVTSDMVAWLCNLPCSGNHSYTGTSLILLNLMPVLLSIGVVIVILWFIAKDPFRWLE